MSLAGSTILPTLLNNFSASAGKMDFPSICLQNLLILTFDSKYFNLNFVAINTIWLTTPKILTQKWSVCSVISLRALWNHGEGGWGGCVYSLDGCQTGKQEEGLNKSFLTLTLQKQIPKSIRVSSAAGACANSAGQNSHRYLSVTSLANKSSSLAFQAKPMEQAGMKENALCLFKQQLVCHLKNAWNIYNRFWSW